MRSSGALLLVLVATGCGSASAPPLPADAVVFVRYGEQRADVWIGARRLGPGSRPVVSPDRRWIAVATRAGAVDVVDSRDRRRLSTRGTVVAWSPDSRRILVDAGGDLRVVDVDTRAVRTVARRVLFGASFSPDGKRVAFARGRRRVGESACGAKPDLYAVPVDGGRPHRLTGDGRSDFPVWGPRGIAFARIARNCSRFTADVWLLDPHTGAKRRLVSRRGGSGFYGVLPVAWVPRRPLLVTTVNAEFGGPGVVVDVRTNVTRDLGWSPCSFTHDGRRIVVLRPGAEAPYAVATVSLDGRDRRVVARGDVSC